MLDDVPGAVPSFHRGPVSAMMPRKMPWLRCFLPVALVLASCRSVTTSFDYPDDLRNPNYVKRSLAVRRFAVLKDEGQLPAAFRLLMDKEAPIRVLAHETIRDLSPGGEDFGYKPYLDERVRARIVKDWRSWWVANRATPGEEERRG